MATLTINTTGAQDTRIIAAFGAKFNPPRNATAAEVKADIIGYLKGVVHSYETARDSAIAADAVVAMADPT